MIGTLHPSKDTTTSPHIVMANNQELPIQYGTEIKVKMREKWYRGRYEFDKSGTDRSALLNAGDKTFVIPEGTEIEIMSKHVKKH